MANKWATLYNQLVKKHNKTRKKIIRRKRKQEEEDNARRARGELLPRRPSRVTPRQLKPVTGSDAENMSKEKYEEFKKQINEWKTSSELNFYKEAYKQNYLDVLRENMIGEDPDSREIFGGKYTTNKVPYSKEQIENCSDKEKQDLMKLYNTIYHMSTAKFMALYDNGYIVNLSYIYHGLTDTKESSFYDEQMAFIEQAKREEKFEKSRGRRGRRNRRKPKPKPKSSSKKKHKYNRAIANAKYINRKHKKRK